MSGLANFHTLFTDDRELLGKALYNAAYLSVFGIPLGMATGLAIAMLLNMKVKGMTWYRTAFYIPSIVPAIASAVLWAVDFGRRPEQRHSQRAVENHFNRLVRLCAAGLVWGCGMGQERSDFAGLVGRGRRHDFVARRFAGRAAKFVRSRRD